MSDFYLIDNLIGGLADQNPPNKPAYPKQFTLDVMNTVASNPQTQSKIQQMAKNYRSPATGPGTGGI